MEETVEKMKIIQKLLLDFLEDESNSEENYEILIKNIADQKIIDDKYEFKSLLYLINNIGKNHQRVCNFICKIEQILSNFKIEILNYFSNSEIFKIFEDNKRVLLFLIQEKIINIDGNIVNQITKMEFIDKKYPQYFGPEIQPFLTEEFTSGILKTRNDPMSFYLTNKWIREALEEVQSDFYDKRKQGENDNYLCELIRLNKTKEFIVYVNKNNISLQNCIPISIFETNSFLLNNKTIKLIEYAAFHGANEIIRYMKMNGVELTPNIWKYAIHSENEELIKYLEDNQVLPPGKNYETILKESIKCHHNDLSNYIINYLFKEEDFEIFKGKNYDDNLYYTSFKYSNYAFFPDSIKYKHSFFYSCQFDYFKLVNLLLKSEKININATIVKKHQYFELHLYQELIIMFLYQSIFL